MFCVLIMHRFRRPDLVSRSDCPRDVLFDLVRVNQLRMLPQSILKPAVPWLGCDIFMNADILA